MQLGMLGLGRMGGGMVRRLLAAGHTCVVYDPQPASVAVLAAEGATPAASYAELVAKLDSPRAIWLMLPSAVVDEAIVALAPLLAPGDTLIDGGNSHYRDDLQRAEQFKPMGLHYLDVGVSGGVWGRTEGFCLMIGGEASVVQRLDPIFRSLAPGSSHAPPTPDRKSQSTAELGYLHCGAHGAGHFVKMVHNGIEYGMMQAYAEGLNILKHAGAGAVTRRADAETAPLADPQAYRYDFKVEEVAELWRRGSVIRSWLLDLAAHALVTDPALDSFAGGVADSGEGRWTLQAAIDTSVPVPVLSAALYARFASRGEDDFGNRLLSALRKEFGGHAASK